VKVAVVYPELLGTYGDGGNGLVVVERARRRGIEVQLNHVRFDNDLPDADLYLLGGGEDGPQRLAADLLRASSLGARIADGAKVFAVCAGLQILGTTFCVEGNDQYEGLGLVEVVTRRGLRRTVGELAVRVDDGVLVGFENHGGVTTLADGVAPLGTVMRGRGNDGHLDGFRAEGIVATYAHGPVLAMNPWFADHLLEWVLNAPLEPLASAADLLYAHRRTALGL